MSPRILALLLCSLSPCVLPVAAQSPAHSVSCSPRSTPLTEADRAFGDRRWDKAAPLYLADASFKNEEGWRAYDGAIRSLLEDGKMEAAEAELAKMKSQDAKNPWTLLGISRVEWREGHIDEGIRAAVAAFEAAPCNAMMRYHLARLHNFPAATPRLARNTSPLMLWTRSTLESGAHGWIRCRARAGWRNSISFWRRGTISKRKTPYAIPPGKGL